MVRLKGFEASRDDLPRKTQQPQGFGAYWVPTSRTGIAPCHNVGYELVKSFDGVVVTNIPITVNPIIGCITPSQYLAARNLQKVEAEFALQRYVHDVA